MVENFTARGVAGIVLARLDDRALVAPVEAASAAKIPVVIIDPGIKTERITIFVATNNDDRGRKADQRLVEVLVGKGRILLLRYQQGSASTMQREAGFFESIAAVPGIAIVSSDQYVGSTRDSALTAGQNLCGSGTVLGSIIGALMMTVLRNGAHQLDWPPYVQEILIGAAFVMAVLIDR